MALTDERQGRSSTGCGRTARSDRSPRDAVLRRKLLRAARRGDRGARERVVVAHLGLVRALAGRYRDLGLPFDDLVQEGSLGLLDAIESYDPSHDVDFEAFARFRIRRAIRNALTDQARLVRLPKQVVERRRMLAHTEANLMAATGRAPTPVELAAVTGLSPAAVLEARNATIAPLSLDQPTGPGGTLPVGVVADATAPDPEAEAISAERARLVRAAVASLPPRQREVIAKHFGLEGEVVDMATLASQLRLSERRTRTIEHDGLHALAAELEPVATRRRSREPVPATRARSRGRETDNGQGGAHE